MYKFYFIISVLNNDKILLTNQLDHGLIARSHFFRGSSYDNQLLEVIKLVFTKIRIPYLHKTKARLKSNKFFTTNIQSSKNICLYF